MYFFFFFAFYFAFGFTWLAMLWSFRVNNEATHSMYINTRWASQVAPVERNLAANTGEVRKRSSIYGSEDPLEKDMTTYSSILAWRIPCTEEAGKLWSTGS